MSTREQKIREERKGPNNNRGTWRVAGRRRWTVVHRDAERRRNKEEWNTLYPIIVVAEWMWEERHRWENLARHLQLATKPGRSSYARERVVVRREG